MGEVFAGRYELVDLIDSGGVGSVWRAWDHREHAYRAVKLLRQSDGDSLLRFVRETSRRIDHPHVLAPLSWSGEDDRVLFSMPLVRGGSLAGLIADYGALPVGLSVELLRQALVALDAVHGAGLVHRDVKPANLLLQCTGTDRPHLLLSDFGAAAQLGAPRLTSVDSVIGTPGYLAPEQRFGADPDPRQDLYALGVVGTAMRTGREPERPGVDVDGNADTGASSGTGDRAASYGPAEEAGAALARLLAELTDPDPARRPATAMAVLDRLERLPGAGDRDLGADPQNPIEIFDQVGPPPPGWTLDGPEPTGAPESQPPGVPASSPEPVRTTQASTPTSTAVAPARASTDRSGRAASAVSSSASRRRRPVPRAAVVLAVVGVVLIVVAVLLELG